MRRPPLRGLAAALAFALLAAPVAAHFPGASTVARAAAEQNRKAGRTRGVALEVAVLEADGSEAGSGQILLDPAGRARVEIVSARGEIDRQLWNGARVEASRDGVLTPGARSLLPPLHLLQTASGAELQAALSALGGRAGHVELGYEGEHDAWVLGGRDGSPAVWIDNETHVIVRLDWGTTRARLGWPTPAVEAAWPSAIELESDGFAPLRLEIRGSKPTQVSADAFAPAWLTR